MSDKKELLEIHDVIELADLDEEESSEFTEHKQNLANSISRQLIKRGWTPEMLAERTGIPADFIRDAKQGMISFSHKTASKLALALGCDISEVDPSRKGETAEIYKD